MVACHLYLPQLRMPLEEIVDRARLAEAAGFEGIAFMDHLAPPRASDQPMFEAMTTAAWIAAHTARLRIGHLVLCDSFRHPALLAKQAATLQHASNGRFELGLGWGSTPNELEAFGIGSVEAPHRVGRLGETLQVLDLLWSGELVSFVGTHHKLRGVRQLPVPTERIPLVVGGTGRATLELVSRHADWWNVPGRQLGRLDELRERVGSARVSVLIMVGLVHSEDEREQTTTLVQRRFGAMMGDSLIIGDAAEVSERLNDLRARGVERFYIWLADFASRRSIEAFHDLAYV